MTKLVNLCIIPLGPSSCHFLWSPPHRSRLTSFISFNLHLSAHTPDSDTGHFRIWLSMTKLVSFCASLPSAHYPATVTFLPALFLPTEFLYTFFKITYPFFQISPAPPRPVAALEMNAPSMLHLFSNNLATLAHISRDMSYIAHIILLHMSIFHKCLHIII